MGNVCLAKVLVKFSHENGFSDVVKKIEAKENDKTYTFPGYRINKNTIGKNTERWLFYFETYVVFDELQIKQAIEDGKKYYIEKVKIAKRKSDADWNRLLSDGYVSETDLQNTEEG